MNLLCRECQAFRVIAVTFVLGLVGCSQQMLLEKFAPPEDQAFAESQIQLLRSRDFEPIEKAMEPRLVGPNFRETLSQMADMIPAGDPDSVKLVGVNVSTNYSSMKSSETFSNITYEYSYPNKWLLINVATRKTSRGVTIVGFRVQPLDQSLEDQNRFTLSGKSVLQYTVLGLAIAIPLFSLCVLVLCVRTPLKRRKWLWIVFILLGFGRLAVNWTTGEWLISPLYIQLLGASVFAPLYGPWTIAVSVPLGAILFLIKRDKLRAVKEDAEVAHDQSGASSRPRQAE